MHSFSRFSFYTGYICSHNFPSSSSASSSSFILLCLFVRSENKVHLFDVYVNTLCTVVSQIRIMGTCVGSFVRTEYGAPLALRSDDNMLRSRSNVVFTAISRSAFDVFSRLESSARGRPTEQMINAYLWPIWEFNIHSAKFGAGPLAMRTRLMSKSIRRLSTSSRWNGIAPHQKPMPKERSSRKMMIKWMNAGIHCLTDKWIFPPNICINIFFALLYFARAHKIRRTPKQFI